ncbi:hypothetical protein B484DRAFT_402820 [Ochromonadaceae sp. CCMP2298]|nr:hypothetical protein B484DRAFT_402820 [Ochromonadaceae sp. CCMP2298]
MGGALGSVLSTEDAARLEVGRQGCFYEYLQRCHDLGMSEENIKVAMAVRYKRLLEYQTEQAREVVAEKWRHRWGEELSFKVRTPKAATYRATPFEIEVFRTELGRKFSPKDIGKFAERQAETANTVVGTIYNIIKVRIAPIRAIRRGLAEIEALESTVDFLHRHSTRSHVVGLLKSRMARLHWHTLGRRIMQRKMVAKMRDRLLTCVDLESDVALLERKYFYAQRRMYDLHCFLHRHWGVVEVVPTLVPYDSVTGRMAEVEGKEGVGEQGLQSGPSNYEQDRSGELVRAEHLALGAFITKQLKLQRRKTRPQLRPVTVPLEKVRALWLTLEAEEGV